MPIHDWTRVDAGIFHDFHNTWIAELKRALNQGLLPKGYYALSEQHAGRLIPDILALHARPQRSVEVPAPASGGLLVAESAPRVTTRITASPSARTRRRSLAVRHVSGHQLIALVEIVSPANKDRREHVEEFASKVVWMLNAGVHVLLVDLFPAGRHDPGGMHGAVWSQIEGEPVTEAPPAREALTLASYVAGVPVEAYIERCAVGQLIPDMPLFLEADRYINVPMEPTYDFAFQASPDLYRMVLEGG